MPNRYSPCFKRMVDTLWLKARSFTFSIQLDLSGKIGNAFMKVNIYQLHFVLRFSLLSWSLSPEQKSGAYELGHRRLTWESGLIRTKAVSSSYPKEGHCYNRIRDPSMHIFCSWPLHTNQYTGSSAINWRGNSSCLPTWEAKRTSKGALQN